MCKNRNRLTDTENKLVVTSRETQTRGGLFGIKRDQTTMYKINNRCIGNTLHIAKDFLWQDGLGAAIPFSTGSSQYTATTIIKSKNRTRAGLHKPTSCYRDVYLP